MKKLNEYETPITDAYIGEQDGVILTPGEQAMCDFARDLERKLALCRRALEGIVALGEVMPEPAEETDIAIEALEATK